MFIKTVKLCLKSAVMIKRVLFIVECSWVAAIINDIHINMLFNFNF